MGFEGYIEVYQATRKVQKKKMHKCYRNYCGLVRKYLYYE